MFRAIRKDTGEWVEGYLNQYKGQPYIIGKLIEVNGEHATLEYCYPVREETIEFMDDWFYVRE